MLFRSFLQEYHAELQRLQAEARRRIRSIERDQQDLQRQTDRLVDAIAEGTVGDIGAVGAKLRELEKRLAALQPVSQPEPATIDLHPKAVEVYKRKVADLATALQTEGPSPRRCSKRPPGARRQDRLLPLRKTRRVRNLAPRPAGCGAQSRKV